MIDLYFWPTPNGWKTSIMLEELGIPYNVIPVNIGKGDQFKPDFLKISPNNRMPAIVDHDPLDGGPAQSVFESAAILLYLARKYGKFLPKDPRAEISVMEWLFWQMGGLGPMAGQAHHFRLYAPEKIPYAIDRYVNECNRLYGVLNKQLEGRDYIAGEYSIADIACWPWIARHERQLQDLNDFPNLKAWFERVGERPAVKRGFNLNAELQQQTSLTSEDSQKILFNQKAT
ncbi:glutathione S-transferase N-terminal domain-containing protein [Sneathiella glossodoripedis]|uniref:glutathione S-transferase N-terminal domain-containing protein n=1 Tax=Sneathiella glossodoripedis TaxID=418853 RepID=UPI000472DFF0|nr:glutathione S-transferase N-terminal domain-containing protein [Sneathiella glossodoripedis]